MTNDMVDLTLNEAKEVARKLTEKGKRVQLVRCPCGDPCGLWEVVVVGQQS